MKWVSIDESLPPHGCICLVNTTSNYDYGYIVARFIAPDYWEYSEDGSNYHAYSVTHYCIIEAINL
jgi:hypothetical protein